MPSVLKINNVPPSLIHNQRREIGDFLALIPEEGPRLSWRIFPMSEATEIIGDFTDIGMNAAQLCQAVDTSPSGLILSWETLKKFSENVFQTIWGHYIGCRDEFTFGRLAMFYEGEWFALDQIAPEFFEKVEFAFQQIDSSYWLVFVKEDAVAERLLTVYSDAEKVRT